MTKLGTYFLLFFPILIALKPITFMVFNFFNGFIEALLVTAFIVFMLEIIEKKLEFLSTLTKKQFNYLIAGSFLVSLGLWAYFVSQINLRTDGRLESTALYAITHFRSWAGYESSILFSSWVGIVGFLISLTCVITLHSTLVLKKPITTKAFSTIPIFLFYLLLYLRKVHVAIPVFSG